MPDSGRFPVAVHVLTLLAHEKGRTLTSAFVAGSVNTNAVVIRRVLRLLGRAGLVSTSEGARGGTRLARPPEAISLAHAYAAVESDRFFGEARGAPNPLCPVGRSVRKVLAARLERLERGLRREMDEVTIADVLAGVRQANRTALLPRRRSR